MHPLLARNRLGLYLLGGSTGGDSCPADEHRWRSQLAESRSLPFRFVLCTRLSVLSLGHGQERPISGESARA